MVQAYFLIKDLINFKHQTLWFAEKIVFYLFVFQSCFLGNSLFVCLYFNLGFTLGGLERRTRRLLCALELCLALDEALSVFLCLFLELL